MTATDRYDVAVVGSIDQDLGIGLDRTPRLGETVFGDDVRWSAGGKGANQAAACARLGLRTAIVGTVGRDAVGARLRARSLDGPDAVVVTLGAEGALVVTDHDAVHVPAVPVAAVDATGAGDSFCAGLVAELLDGATLVAAARLAVRVAAATTLRPGAMEALPTHDEVDRLLADGAR